LEIINDCKENLFNIDEKKMVCNTLCDSRYINYVHDFSIECLEIRSLTKFCNEEKNLHFNTNKIYYTILLSKQHFKRI